MRFVDKRHEIEVRLYADQTVQSDSGADIYQAWIDYADDKGNALREYPVSMRGRCQAALLMRQPSIASPAR